MKAHREGRSPDAPRHFDEGLFPLEAHCPFCGRAIAPKEWYMNVDVKVAQEQKDKGPEMALNRLYYCKRLRKNIKITMVWFGDEVYTLRSVTPQNAKRWKEEDNSLEERGDPTTVDDYTWEDGAI